MQSGWESILLELDAKLAAFAAEHPASSRGHDENGDENSMVGNDFLGSPAPQKATAAAAADHGETLQREFAALLARGYPRCSRVSWLRWIMSHHGPSLELQGFLTAEFTPRKLKTLSQSVEAAFVSLQDVRFLLFFMSCPREPYRMALPPGTSWPRGS